MAEMAMMAASLFSTILGAKQTQAVNKAEAQQQAARDETAEAELEELKRQQERADEVAAEEKSDAARELDLQLGTLIAAAADGGVTGAALARAGGAAAAVAGLDVARIESNRADSQGSRRASGLSIMRENKAQGQQTKQRIDNNNSKFIGNAAGRVFSFAFNATPDATPSKTSKSDIRDTHHF